MKARPATTAVWPAPAKGLIRSGNFVGAPMDAAEVLDNFIPTTTGARQRGGALLHATVAAPVVQMMNYRSGAVEALFAATATAVYDVSAPVDPEVSPAASISGLTSGNWSFVQFATAGGEFLWMVNGADAARHYNGTAWAIPTITGVSSAILNFVWAHKRRIWAVENNTLSAWYLPVNSIAGAMVEFPLDGVFRLGGRLLFGGTWSLDSGDGLDDNMVFVTSEGEIAVYQGSNPADAADWSLVGVYRIGRPLNKNAWFRAGGDLVILTEDGIVPVSEALQKDRAALQTASITAPIEELWQGVVASRSVTSRFPVVLWPTRTLLLIGAPDQANVRLCFVANTRTGAWCRITGWDIQALGIYQDQVFFGTRDNRIARADSGGWDMGLPYASVYVPKFQELGTPDDKVALHARVTYRATTLTPVRLDCFQNYSVGAIPVVDPLSAQIGSKWGGGGKWGTGIKWGGSASKVAVGDWQAVSGMGFSLAPCLVVTSNRLIQPDFEISSMQLRFERGRAL
ncbi:MAG: hypothetical protein ACRC6I_13955 [Paracoccaceae bacterium]